MSKILANQIANFGDDSPIELKEGLNIPTGKPIQTNGSSGNSGQVLSSTGASVSWVTPFSGSYNDLTNQPTIPATQVNSDWNSVGTISAILNKPVIPPQSSVVINSASGGSSLSYNPVNGEFSYTPPDLSGYAASTNVANWDSAYAWGDHALVGYASSTNVANWDSAYAWGDHALAGYLQNETDTLQTVTSRGSSITNNINFGDGVGVRFGSSTFNDLQISSDGVGNSIINSRRTLDIISDDTADVGTIKLRVAGNVDGIRIDDNGEVILYHNDVNRLTTTSTGVTVAGNLNVTGSTTLDVGDLNNVDLSVAAVDGQILKYQQSTSTWIAANDLQGNQETGIALSDISVSTQPVGNATLSYNNTSGVFTFTPPDLSNYLTSYTETDPVFTSSVAFGIIQQNINNWNAAYGWGDHSTAGYITSLGDAGGVTTAKITEWDTAYGWGDHSVAGYLTSYTETQTLDAVLTLGATTTQDITTTGKVYFSNNFAALGDLPSATTYHGMFAHVHGEGHGYFAHAGAWTQLVDTGSNLSELADVATTAPNTSDVLTWDGANWGPAAPTGGSGGANVTISDTAPGSASAGDLWWESDRGRLKIYYNDTDSTQWVDASPPLSPTNISNITTNGNNQLVVTDENGVSNAIEIRTDDGTTENIRWKFIGSGSLLPALNDAYDIGSPSLKVRDIYEADPSDIRLKKDIVDYNGGLNFIDKLRVVNFTWRDTVDNKAGKKETGLIAQEVKLALDDSNYESWRLHTNGVRQGIDKKQLIPALISAVQELSARVKELESK